MLRKGKMTRTNCRKLRKSAPVEVFSPKKVYLNLSEYRKSHRNGRPDLSRAVRFCSRSVRYLRKIYGSFSSISLCHKRTKHNSHRSKGLLNCVFYRVTVKHGKRVSSQQRGASSEACKFLREPKSEAHF